jgi:hypothetical protein
VNVSLEPVASPTLFGGEQTFRIDVPANATQLQVRFTTDAQAQLALYVRSGSQPVVENGRVVADHSAQSATGTVTVTIGAGSSPALQTGSTYFVRIANFTANVAVNGSLSTTVATGGGGGGTTGQALTSGASRNLTFPSGVSGRLFNGSNGFFIDVPEGATSLQVQLRTSTPGADVDLFVRRGQDVAVASGAVVSDYKSEGLAGDELITITPASTPALQAGRYFIAFGVFTANVAINSTVTATVGGGGGGSGSGTGSGGGTLTPGTASNLTLPAVSGATLFNGARSFQLTVPENATRVEIELRTSTPGADVDLYARFGQDVAVVNGRVASDLSSTGSTGDETIVLTGEQLRAGTWFIALAVFTPGVDVEASVVARITTQSSGGSQSGVITPGSPGQFRIGPVTGATLFRGSNNGFRFEVPSNVTRVDISLSTAPAAADVDLYVRYEQDIGLENGAVAADYKSEGEAGTENITITPDSNPALRAGTYFVGLGLFTRNVAASGTVTVTFTTADGGGGGSAPTGAILTSGVEAPMALPAVEAPTLFNGEYSYQIEVPEGATSLTVRLASDVSTADTDLYVRRGADPVVEDGNVTADYSATTRFANESLVIDRSSSPPLEPGTYFISVAQFTPGVAVTGRVTASVERASLAPPVSTSLLLQPGEERPFALPEVQGATLVGGELGFRIDVPAGSGQMRVALACSPETGDVDLFLRYGAEPQIENGRVVADHASVGDFASESILVSANGAPPLRAGTYFVGFAIYTPRTPFNCAIRADLDAAPTEIAPSDSQEPESAITSGKTRAGKAAGIAREHWVTEQRPALADKAADSVLLKKSIGTTVSRKEE